MNFYEKAVYERKFILPFYFALLRQLMSHSSIGDSSIGDSSTGDSSGAVQLSKAINLKNPHMFTKDESKENLAAKLEKKDILKIFYFESAALREKTALEYFVQKLRKENIKVVIILMPLHPLVRKAVTQESKKLFKNYLSTSVEQYGIKIINLEDKFSEGDFTDLTHLNKEGAQVLAEELMRGEYHLIQ